MTTRITIETDKDLDPNEVQQATVIFHALLKSGGMFGVKGGKTIMHFDAQGMFMGVQLDYWPWRRRKEVER